MVQAHSLFFYGTLCHAAVLRRVIGNNGQHLTCRDAILEDHVRLHVAGEDYPAVVSVDSAESAQLLKRSLEATERRVQGVLVQELTDEDEYDRRPCSVSLLSTAPSSSSSASSLTPIPATVYLWTARLSRLEPRIWSFTDFLRDSAHRWVGSGANSNPEYVEVDRRRNMKGVITPRGVREESAKVLQGATAQLSLDQKEDGGGGGEEHVNGTAFEPFGRQLAKKYWRFEEGWVNLNHGSYGAAPLPVVECLHAIQARCDSAPDRFMRVEYEQELIDVRTRLADFVDCETDDLVLVPNATSGVNEALRGLTTEWNKGDRLLFFSSSIYNACSSTLQYIVDTHPHLDLELLPVVFTYPKPHAEVVRLARDAIERANSDGTGRRVRLALIDAISSAPGVVVPWEDLVELFREQDVISLVDAAHQIGQLPVSLRTSKPDFWISNCHKWLHAHRGVAVLYVDKKFQHLVHSSPIGHYYGVKGGFVNEHSWSGTVDWSPYLSVAAALDFRRDVLGGEERIYQYCFDLAVQGGELVAAKLGTNVMRNATPEEGELIATMVNVELPLPAPSTFSTSDLKLLNPFWFRELASKHQTVVPIFAHGDVFWTRLSAQVYNDLNDFAHVAKALKTVCEQITAGSWR
ncbi:PLP-dependent transferase [Rhodotorula sp. JG-1b]|nr:PLP-dependent transferase [Rhodotorula sp. JG-1b]